MMGNVGDSVRAFARIISIATLGTLATKVHAELRLKNRKLAIPIKTVKTDLPAN